MRNRFSNQTRLTPRSGTGVRSPRCRPPVEHDLRAGSAGGVRSPTWKSSSAAGDRFVGSDGRRGRPPTTSGSEFRGSWASRSRIASSRRSATATTSRRASACRRRAQTSRRSHRTSRLRRRPEGVEGELVFVGGGEEADYDGVDVDGKIAVMQEVGLRLLAFLARVRSLRSRHAGARAAMVVDPSAALALPDVDGGRATGNLDRRFCSRADPGRLRLRRSTAPCCSTRSARRRPRPDSSSRARCPTVTSWNVSGVLRGDEWPDERIVVHAHRDHGLQPGANDNGSGSARCSRSRSALADAAPAALDRVPLHDRGGGHDAGRRGVHRGQPEPRARSERFAPRSTSTCSASAAS